MTDPNLESNEGDSPETDSGPILDFHRKLVLI